MKVQFGFELFKYSNLEIFNIGTPIFIASAIYNSQDLEAI